MGCGVQATPDSVHPHIRGAYGAGDRKPLSDVGSSPHTWGIPLGADGASDSWRFIPTYVGHTDFVRRVAEEMAVHPHIRGAYSIKLGVTGESDGSSPHTWGIRF